MNFNFETSKADYFNLFITLLHSERPKLCTILAFLSEIGLIKCMTDMKTYLMWYYSQRTDMFNSKMVIVSTGISGGKTFIRVL